VTTLLFAGGLAFGIEILDSIECWSAGDDHWTVLTKWRLPCTMHSFELQVIDHEYLMIAAGVCDNDDDNEIEDLYSRHPSVLTSFGSNPITLSKGGYRTFSTTSSKTLHQNRTWLFALHQLPAGAGYKWLEGPLLPSSRITVGSAVL
jgi:hypothetical protein